MGGVMVPTYVTGAKSIWSEALAVLVLSGVLAADASVGHAQPKLDERGVLSYSSIVEPVKRSIVKLECQLPEDFVSAGSGSIIDKDGYILTNAHVIEDAKKCDVYLDDLRVIPDGKIIGFDTYADIGLVKINAPDLTPIEIGDSNMLKPGDVVFAIGSPLGLFQSVTAGIVSALGRPEENSFLFRDFIQTDATTFHGNSGGALIDSRGRIVGIPSEGTAYHDVEVAGLNLAIPINLGIAFAEQLKKYGNVRRGFIGYLADDFTPDKASNPLIKANLGATAVKRGAVISGLENGGPAALAGLLVGDIVVSANAAPILGANNLRNAVAVLRPGAELALSIVRNGHQMTIKIRIEGPSTGDSSIPQLFGAMFGAVPPSNELAKRLISEKVLASLNGVVMVTSVAPNTLAAKSGLLIGDLLRAVNGKTFDGMESLKNILASAGEPTVLTIWRGNSQQRPVTIRQ